MTLWGVLILLLFKQFLWALLCLESVKKATKHLCQIEWSHSINNNKTADCLVSAMGPSVNVGGNGGSEGTVIYGLQPPRTLDKRKWKTSIILSASPYPGDLHGFFFSHCIFCSFFPQYCLEANGAKAASHCFHQGTHKHKSLVLKIIFLSKDT